MTFWAIGIIINISSFILEKIYKGAIIMAKKPTFVFQFPTKGAAEMFIIFATRHPNNTLVQLSPPPFPTGLYRVNVRGTGHNESDFKMRQELTSYAKYVGGDVIPRRLR